MRSTELSVIDFDGTLVPFNSFPKWIVHIFLCAIKNLSLYDASKIALLLLTRKLGILSHQGLKKCLMESKHPEQWDISFARKMERQLNQSVIEYITPYIKNTICIVSSAAPARYISKINFHKHLPIHTVIGSHITANENHIHINENFQQIKLENILFRFPQSKIKYVITDHHDDIPLIKEAQTSIIINSTKKTRQLIDQNTKISSIIFFNSLPMGDYKN